MIDGILSGIGGLIDTGYNIYSQNKNYELQKEAFNYQKDLNKQIMAREDTAVQRRANDLQNAGMSKWLAAGQGASSSVMSSGQAPSSSPQLNLQQGINNALSVYGAVANARNTEANTAQALAQADLIKANTFTEINYRRSQIEADTSLSRQQKNNLLKEYDKITHDLNLSRIQGIRSSDQMHSVYNSATSFVEKTFNTLDKGKQIIKRLMNGSYK